MKQIQFDHPGSADLLRVVDAPMPQAGPGELLIRVAAAGVNRPDVFQRMGLYPPPPEASPILGLEVAGTVEAVGDGVEGWQRGDAVCALTPGGGYAEYARAPAAHCLRLPRGLSMIEAAALPEPLFTVWSTVFMRAALKPGERLLVHGGASGIGTTTIQLAKAFGATVYTTARTAERCAACVALGADVAIPHAEQDFVDVIRAHTQGQGVDVILDMVGGDYIPRNLECLGLDGRLVFIAFLRGSKVSVDFATVMRKRLTISGATLRPQTTAAKAAIADALRERVWPLLDEGRLRPAIHATFALAEAAAAHRLMEQGEHIGKIVLEMPGAGHPG